MIAYLSIYQSPQPGFNPSNSGLLNIQQQIQVILQAAIDEADGPFAELQIETNSLQVQLRKYSMGP